MKKIIFIIISLLFTISLFGADKKVKTETKKDSNIKTETETIVKVEITVETKIKNVISIMILMLIPAIVLMRRIFRNIV